MQDLDLEKLEDSTFILDVLIQAENVLDSLDAYVYANWIEGEIVKGPVIRRHWVTFSLRYPYDKMPDPRAALRFLKHGIQIEFNTIKQKEPGDIATPDHEPKKSDWLVTVTIPRRLMDDINEADLEYEDDVNTDDVEDAKDSGLDDESSFNQDEQLPGGDDRNMEQPPPQAAPPPATEPQR